MTDARGRLRGVTANIVILEEAAFIKEALFFEVIAPLLGVENTCVLAISTPDVSEENYYSMLMDLDNPDCPGDQLFKTIRIGLACEECVQKGKSTACTHKSDFVPPWKSSNRQRKMKQIYKNFPALNMRENFGMLTNENHHFFDQRILHSFLKSKPYKFRDPPDIIYTAIDPSGGGTQSDYAVVSFAYDKGHYVIISMSSSPSAKSREIDRMTYDHVANLRRHSTFKHAYVHVYIERNLSNIEANRVQETLSHASLMPVGFEHRDPQGKGHVGVTTTEQSKRMYVRLLQDVLMAGQLRYSEHFLYEPLSEDDSVDRIKGELHSQMRAFKLNVKKPEHPQFGKFTVTMSGKTHSKKDDLLMSLMMGMYFSWMSRHSDPSFQRFCLRESLRMV